MYIGLEEKIPHTFVYSDSDTDVYSDTDTLTEDDVDSPGILMNLSILYHYLFYDYNLQCERDHLQGLKQPNKMFMYYHPAAVIKKSVL